MRRIMKWFCLFIIYGLILTILQANNVDTKTTTWCLMIYFLIVFLFWKFKRKKKEDIQINHIGTLKEENIKNDKPSPDYDENLDNFINAMNENEQRIINETFDLINNSKNIETVLSRIQFGYDKGFIKDKNELQMTGIERCYQILLDKPTPKNKAKSIEKYFSQVDEHKNEFSLQVNEFIKTFIQTSEPLINVEIKHDLPFDEEYLNTVLEDGKSIREHMQEDFNNAMKRSQGMDKQQEIELNDLEKQFIGNFLDYLKLFNLDTEIRYNRMSNKCLNFTYRNMQIGRVKLNGRKMWIQILYKKAPIVERFDISNVDEAITYLDKWIEYINYLIKD